MHSTCWSGHAIYNGLLWLSKQILYVLIIPTLVLMIISCGGYNFNQSMYAPRQEGCGFPAFRGIGVKELLTCHVYEMNIMETYHIIFSVICRQASSTRYRPLDTKLMLPLALVCSVCKLSLKNLYSLNWYTGVFRFVRNSTYCCNLIVCIYNHLDRVNQLTHRRNGLPTNQRILQYPTN